MQYLGRNVQLNQLKVVGLFDWLIGVDCEGNSGKRQYHD
jgi:hypothetical protein